MRLARKLHLYFGCFFAPTIVIFALSGAYQALGYHKCKLCPKVQIGIFNILSFGSIESLVSLHMNPNGRANPSRPACLSYAPSTPEQQIVESSQKKLGSASFKIFVLFFCLTLVFSTISGILMAFQHTKKRAYVMITLLLGILVPLAIV